METYRPFIVVGGVPVNNGIRFAHPLQTITIDSHIELVWEILKLSDGHTEARKIAQKASKSIGVNRELAEAVIDDLTTLEVLVDSRRAYKFFHNLGNNLTMFATDMRPEEVYDFQISVHPPVKTGAATIMPSLESVVGKYGHSRTSCRSFSTDTIGIEKFGEILRVAFSRKVASSPSGGGLNPIRAYVIITRAIGELVPGKYEYDADTEQLVCFESQFDRQEIEFALNSDTILYGAEVILVVASELDRQPTKYANRGYRYALVEAGHAAQTVLLTCQELGVASLEYCGFQDDKLAKSLGIEGSGIAPIVTIALGKASTKQEDDKIAELHTALSEEIVGRGRPVTWVNMVNRPGSDDGYSFFHCISHFKAGDHENARASYRDRLCGGTSTSLSLATVKAAVEAYERNRSGSIRVDHVGSADSFSRSTAWLDPRVYAPYSSEQLKRNALLQPFDSQKEWEWVQGYDLLSGSPVYVPIDLVFYPLSEDKLGRRLCHYGNSSGIAAHSTTEAAIEGALLELVERDAVMRNWYEQVPPHKIVTELLPLHWRKRVEYWGKQGFEVQFLNLSHSGIAIIEVAIFSDKCYPHFVTGTAASIESLEAAYAKAYQEAELTLLHFKSLRKRNIKREDIVQPLDHGRHYAQFSNRSSVDYLRHGCHNIPSEPTSTIGALIEKYRPRVVDLSGQYPRLKVVRVFSEDLVPVNFGYGVEHHTHKSLPDFVRQKRVDELEPHYLA